MQTQDCLILNMILAYCGTNFRTISDFRLNWSHWSRSIGTLGNDDWPPSVELYDFLKIMDEEEPGFAKQRVPQEDDDDEEEEVDEAESTTEEATSHSSYRTPHHSEL